MIKALHIELLHSCPLNCLACDHRTLGAARLKQASLSALHALPELKGLELVSFSGGEPLLSPGLAAVIAGAAAAFRLAADLDPARPGPLNNLGNLAYLAKDFDGAIGWWEKSLAAAPEQIDARLNLAKLLCETGRLKKCSGQLDEVLRRDPSNAKARVLYKKMVE